MVKLSGLTKAYYKSGEVACMLGVTTITIMLYDDNGQISFEKTAAGRRIISKKRLVKYLEDKDLLINNMLCAKHDVVYARVSTHKQESLLAFANDKNPKDLIVLKEVRSGLNDNRKNLLKLIKMILSR